jgi:N-acetylneuraminic acid mutarotase
MLPNGQVLIAGGYTGRSHPDMVYTVTTEIYDPVAENWRNTGAMNQARANHTATLLPDGTVLVTGGGYVYFTGGISFATAEIYDPTTGAWTYTGSMNEARVNHTATLLPDGTVLVIGGYITETQGVCLNRCKRYI